MEVEGRRNPGSERPDCYPPASRKVSRKSNDNVTFNGNEELPIYRKLIEKGPSVSLHEAVARGRGLQDRTGVVLRTLQLKVLYCKYLFETLKLVAEFLSATESICLAVH